MSAAALVGMDPQLAQLSALLAQQQSLQVEQNVAAQISAEAGGGVAPIISSSVTAPGALELFA